METSAKAGHNVKSLFKKIAMSLPGMEKDNTETTAQSTSSFPNLLGQSIDRLSIKGSMSPRRLQQRSPRPHNVSAELYCLTGIAL